MVGVAVMVAVIAAAVAFVTANAAMLPVPLPAKPMAVLSFVQLYVPPPVPAKLMAAVLAPAQRVWLLTLLIVGTVPTITAFVAVEEPLAFVTVTV